MDQTERMALAMPTGMIQPAVAWHELHTLLNGVHFPASIDKVVLGEMHRHAPSEKRALPGAAPLVEELRLRPQAADPATEGVRRMDEYLISTIQETIDSIEHAALAKCAA